MLPLPSTMSGRGVVSSVQTTLACPAASTATSMKSRSPRPLVQDAPLVHSRPLWLMTGDTSVRDHVAPPSQVPAASTRQVASKPNVFGSPDTSERYHATTTRPDG